MSEHPVVACYHGPESADAIQLGARLAGALREPLVLATAYHYEPVGHSARAVPAAGNGRRAAAGRAALQHARSLAGTGIEIRERVVPSASVAEALVALARDVDACILVLGRDTTRGRVTRSLVPRAPCPVAVAPLTPALLQMGPLRRIGVAYDASPGAESALIAATRLALATGARLVLLAAGPTAQQSTAWLHAARSTLGEDVAVQTRALVGDVAASLARAGEELDLLVCGSRGRGARLAAILGSVSAHLVAHAGCPVLVVPAVAGESSSDPLGLASAAATA